MSTTQTEPEAKRVVPAWRRLLVAAGWFALFVVAVSAGVYLFTRHRLVSQLDRVLAELDETDPGWRWPDPFQVRHDIPLEENCAERALAIIRDRPRGWPDAKTWDKFQDVQPNMDLDPPRRKLLDGLMAEGAIPRLRAEARDLVKYPRGRLGLTLAENPWTILLPNHQELRGVAALLQFDAHDLALAGNYREALKSSRACLNVSRVLEDDPILISQLVRIAMAAVAMSMAERTMALGDAPDDALAALQKHLEPEARGIRMTVAMRGERASAHQIVLLLSSGKITLQEIEGLDRAGGATGQIWGVSSLISFAGREMARREHADILKMMTKIVETTKLPVKDQFAAEEEVMNQLRSSTGPIMRLVLPAVQKINEAGRRAHCQAIAMRALIAVERYRLKHGKWPAKLEDTVPAFLEKVPLDPIDGSPIRYKRWADGVVVYSIGNNRKDDGGEVLKSLHDYGYRLWDKDKRRAAPPPLPPEVPEGGPGDPPGPP
jgi:hypothetical protein